MRHGYANSRIDAGSQRYGLICKLQDGEKGGRTTSTEAPPTVMPCSAMRQNARLEEGMSI
jgi:hypothetical protein